MEIFKFRIQKINRVLNDGAMANIGDIGKQ